MKVAIAGAGVGGLAAALALSREGVDVELYERREGPDGGGAGIQLGPNATRVLKRLDILDELRPVCIAPTSIVIGDASNGRVLSELPLGDDAVRLFGAPYLTVSRADLHACLMDACGRSVKIIFHFDRAVAGLGGPPGVHFSLEDGQQVEADVLIGADGVRSAVARSPVFRSSRSATGADAQPLALRAVIPRRELTDAFSFSHVGLWLDASAHVVHYPVRSGDALNVVIVCDGDTVRSRRAEAPWRAVVDQGDVAQALEGCGEPVRSLIEAQVPWEGWVLHDDTPADRMASGSVALVGDAAHPVLPYQAQGAAMALEDGEALAVCLGDGRLALEARLRRYASLRSARKARVAGASRRNKTVYNLSGIAGMARNLAMAAAPGHALLRQFSWLYGYDLMDVMAAPVSRTR